MQNFNIFIVPEFRYSFISLEHKELFKKCTLDYNIKCRYIVWLQREVTKNKFKVDTIFITS